MLSEITDTAFQQLINMYKYKLINLFCNIDNKREKFIN